MKLNDILLNFTIDYLITQLIIHIIERKIMSYYYFDYFLHLFWFSLSFSVKLVY